MDEKSQQAIGACRGKLITEVLVYHQMLTLVFEDKTRLSVWDNMPSERGQRSMVANFDDQMPDEMVGAQFGTCVVARLRDEDVPIMAVFARRDGTMASYGWYFANEAGTGFDVIARTWTKERLNVPQ